MITPLEFQECHESHVKSDVTLEMSDVRFTFHWNISIKSCSWKTLSRIILFFVFVLFEFRPFRSLRTIAGPVSRIMSEVFGIYYSVHGYRYLRHM